MTLQGQEVFGHLPGIRDLRTVGQILVELNDLVVEVKDFPGNAIEIQLGVGRITGAMGLDGLVGEVVIDPGFQDPGISSVSWVAR